jgi:hypothetical protein
MIDYKGVYLCPQTFIMSTVKTAEFELALKFITETNSNIFLTGKAGTGKTTFLKHLKENPMKKLAVAAPTGVAAINAGGVTLHSLFQLPFGPYIPANAETTRATDKKTLLSRMKFNSEKQKLFNALELLIIDEASMVPAHTVDAIDTILRTVRHNKHPFGGVQVLFIGDLHQLQPVTKEDDWQILKKYYSSNFFFDSHVLRENIPVMIELSTIFRQKDKNFIDILNGLRDNKLTPDHVQILNGRIDRNFISKNGDGYITLTTHNRSATSLNQIQLKNLHGKQYRFVADVEGEYPENIYPNDVELIFKSGAQVMFIKNDTEEKKYFNGKIGVIENISNDEMTVRCDEESITVLPHRWENFKYTVDPETKEIKETLIGTFIQFPLRLAWAITIHKSQGLTFDKVVIDAENAFANGQVYVALSRATSLEGLILTGRVNERFLGAHEDLLKWKERKHDPNQLPNLFKKARLDYMKQMLFNLFSFDQVARILDKLHKELTEIKYNDEFITWITGISAELGKILKVSKQFEKELRNILKEFMDFGANENLCSRLSSAANYFIPVLEVWKESLLNHPLQITSHSVSKIIDRLLEEMNEKLVKKITKLRICKSGFNFNELTGWKKIFPANHVIKSSYVSADEAKYHGTNRALYNILSEYRKTYSKENDIPEYLIFSNNAIKSCCEFLPEDEGILATLQGFSKTKVLEYGKDVLKIINSYCEQNKLPIKQAKVHTKKDLFPFAKSKRLSPTAMATLDLLKSGKTISEICSIRKMATSTIEGHLAMGIKYGLVDIYKIMTKDEINLIATFFSNKKLNLQTARANANGFSYGKLKMVQAWILTTKD